jgi:ribosomal protein S27E
MSANLKVRCARCGKRLKKGGSAYRLKAELISHFDGYIRVNPNENLEQTVDKINSELEKLNEDDIEKQVYQKFEYLVCPTCRDEVETFLSTGGSGRPEEQ